MFSIRRVIAIPVAAAAIAGSALAVGGILYHATPTSPASASAAPSMLFHGTQPPPAAAPNFFLHG